MIVIYNTDENLWFDDYTNAEIVVNTFCLYSEGYRLSLSFISTE